ncbi:MAG: hypothetical protein QXI16_03860, partial [Sulfolobaceae archaeon]
SSLEHILTVTGFNNPLGKLIIYTVVMLVTVGLMLWIKLELFIIMLVEVVIFAFFIFLGWIPIYMIIILGSIFLLGFTKSISKGG